MMKLETLTGMITELFTEAFPKGRSSAMTTIKDIARLSGYSVGTVSRVLNNHPDVSPKARAVVSRIIYTLVGLAALWCISFFFREHSCLHRGE